MFCTYHNQDIYLFQTVLSVLTRKGEINELESESVENNQVIFSSGKHPHTQAFSLGSTKVQQHVHHWFVVDYFIPLSAGNKLLMSAKCTRLYDDSLIVFWWENVRIICLYLQRLHDCNSKVFLHIGLRERIRLIHSFHCVIRNTSNVLAPTTFTAYVSYILCMLMHRSCHYKMHTNLRKRVPTYSYTGIIYLVTYTHT